MRGAAATGLALLPGALVLAAAAAGWVPTNRDLPTYFVPLRHHTAQVLRGRASPFWNAAVGCGEPYFANPQSALLYPPAWLATLVPAEEAVGLEVGLHLAVLGAGCFLLARRLGAGRWLAAAAGVACAGSGPIVSAAGVLNNLETTAWLPWLWWAALGGSVGGVAVAGALAWLAAEPALALVGGIVAVALLPRRGTAAGLVLAAALVAVQALPFLFWVAGGDRGPASAAAASAIPPLAPAALGALLLPPGTVAVGRAAPFVTTVTLPLWAVLLAAGALRDAGTARRRLAVAGWVMTALAVLPAVPLGEGVWQLITAGLVRHPARLLFPASVALVTAAAACPRRLPWRGATAVGLGVALVGGVLGARAVPTALAILGAVAVLSGVAPAGGVLVGSLALVPGAVAELHLRQLPTRPAIPCFAVQQAAARIYAVAPSEAQVAWVAERWPERAVALGWGYAPLLDGRRTARTFAPLQSRRLARHLEAADQGPAGRWWLEALGADLLVAQHPIPGLPPACAEGGLWAVGNPHAWPQVFVAAALPEGGREPPRHGEVRRTQGGEDGAVWEVAVGAGGGVLVRLVTPDPGWQFSVDGRRVKAVEGPGIVHGVPLPPGQHVVRAWYRPPGLALGAAVSALAVGVLLGGRWRRW